MRVTDTIDLGNRHRIEFGGATWNEAEISIRNRYDLPSGGFTPRNSSEIPIRDVAQLAIETLRRDLMTPQEAILVIQAAAEFLGRQNP